MERRYAAKRDNSCFSEYNGGYSIFHSSGRIGMPLDVFISYAHKDRRLRRQHFSLVVYTLFEAPACLFFTLTKKRKWF